MISKTIHYCWFGGNPLPPLAEKCIQSWKTYCPDYEIIRWDESNYDIATAPLYVRQAYETKKWAFVTDYVRLYALTKYGGIYMDTDVELVKELDAFLTQKAFSGFEDDIHIPTGIMASEKGFGLFEELLHYYDKVSFINPDGSFNLKTNVMTITEYCAKRGFQPNNTYQVIDGFALYPKDYFCPLSNVTGRLQKTPNTMSIHWFSGSWLSEEQRKEMKRMQNPLYRQWRNTVCGIKQTARTVLGDDRYDSLKEKWKKEH